VPTARRATINDARLSQPDDTFDTVMLCTVSSGGTIHARPMVVAAVDEAYCWWFVAPRDSVTHPRLVVAEGRD
jgi:general stress protein 26